MKDKHLAIRIEQCLSLAKASNCPRRKFGALLVDPKEMSCSWMGIMAVLGVVVNYVAEMNACVILWKSSQELGWKLDVTMLK